ncbi:MAG: bifunctional demethylmenaquinone methyltransferase/2-methoxy-6-polyprenyl-1,4-benzoquinol methylase UbiE [Acidobacteriota bacterium]
MRDVGNIREMFSSISGRYDLLNHLLSFNIDRRWRKKLIAMIPARSRLVLDYCCGTSDLGILAAKSEKSIIGLDFSHEMLVEGSRKILKEGLNHTVCLIEADAHVLPLKDGSVDTIMTAFGIRNLVDLERGFSEMARVLTAGGTALIIEFSNPTNIFIKMLYYPYLRFLLPLFGTLISGNRNAYHYLTSTIMAFPEPEKIRQIMEKAGFEKANLKGLSGGIVTLYIANKRTGEQ